MILSVVGLTGLVAYSVCSGSKSIKDFLANEGFILATESGQFQSIFEANKEYLGKYNILSKEQLESFCQNDLNRKVLFRSTFLHERACSISMGEMIKKTGFVEIGNYFLPYYEEYSKNKIKKEITDEIGNDKDKWKNWCAANKVKPYSNSTKPLENDLKELCFAEPWVEKILSILS